MYSTRIQTDFLYDMRTQRHLLAEKVDFSKIIKQGVDQVMDELFIKNVIRKN